MIPIKNQTSDKSNNNNDTNHNDKTKKQTNTTTATTTTLIYNKQCTNLANKIIAAQYNNKRGIYHTAAHGE